MLLFSQSLKDHQQNSPMVFLHKQYIHYKWVWVLMILLPLMTLAIVYLVWYMQDLQTYESAAQRQLITSDIKDISTHLQKIKINMKDRPLEIETQSKTYIKTLFSQIIQTLETINQPNDFNFLTEKTTCVLMWKAYINDVQKNINKNILPILYGTIDTLKFDEHWQESVLNIIQETLKLMPIKYMQILQKYISPTG